jgi:AcrR family transcriptional regulator
MSSPAAQPQRGQDEIEPPRRRLTVKQAETVDRLAAAVVREVRRSGYDGLTVRNVARRAGVAPATAYTYFGSKDHLITEVFWRRLQQLGPPSLDDGGDVESRVRSVVADVALLVADEPELAAACTSAMVATDPDVMHLRERIGGHMRRRLSAALGTDGDPAVLRALELALSGAMLQAGTGHLAYEELPDQLAAVARLVAR